MLWDAGFRRPASIKRLSGIPERTAALYIKDFNEGKSHERKKYKKRKKSSQTTEKVRKVINKARNRNSIKSLRDIQAETGVNREDLKKCIKKHWKAVNEEFLAPYYNSMSQRMDDLIENEGKKINY